AGRRLGHDVAADAKPIAARFFLTAAARVATLARQHYSERHPGAAAAGTPASVPAITVAKGCPRRTARSPGDTKGRSDKVLFSLIYLSRPRKPGCAAGITPAPRHVLAAKLAD